MAAVTGLAGVLVWTEAQRFPALRSFYVDVLGLTPRSDRDGFVNFEWGEQRLTIHVHDEVAGPTTEPHRVMVNLAVDGVDELVARADAAGVTVLVAGSAVYGHPDGPTEGVRALRGSFSTS